MRAATALLAAGVILLGLQDFASLRALGDDHHGQPYSSNSTPQKGEMVSTPAPVATPLPPAAVLYAYPVAPPPTYARVTPRQMWDVRVGDNYYSPGYLFVPSGTTVRWINNGKHDHTVTAFGVWDSGPIGSEGAFSIHLTYPGTYYYHCRLHPREMYGTIVVY